MTPDAFQVAASWLRRYTDCIHSGDLPGLVSCFHPEGYLRDILIFTWNTRCLNGHENIAAYLIDTLPAAALTELQLDNRPGLTPEFGGFTVQLGPGKSEPAVSAGFTFLCKQGLGRGYFSLLLSDTGEWTALTVLMALAELQGHEEVLQDEGIYGGHTLAWSDVVREQREAVEKDPYVLIVGGGQTGLNVAAQFKQMKIKSLVIEKNQNLGDNWRKRYPTLSLHSPKASSTMLYQSFPRNWPVFAPRDKMADWLQQYARLQDIVVWTNSRLLPTPTYDDVSKRWTLIIDRNGSLVTLHPAHIIVAAGALGAAYIPSIGGSESFRGTTVHSTEYQGGGLFAGKRVIVVGAGNSAADICQDLCFNGAQSVTMIQRSGTTVVGISSARAILEYLWPDTLPTEVADFIVMAKPLGLMKRMEKATEAQVSERERETHTGLAEAGFNLITGKGLFSLFYEAYGGYCIGCFIGVDVGCAELIRSGQVRIKQGVEISGFAEDLVIFTDGSSLKTDVVIYA
ncbi:hypothetical protein MVEN_02570300 [Mycena venus]|uniref:FAD/NAD(P)-binding domain-containing protein n=1 Tax=Mycena venus TaxID=2733690 RepID=A0A8H6U3K1_9AGAR|nr:hypothetical protein MVEN_02570300 [Mycena venus]